MTHSQNPHQPAIVHFSEATVTCPRCNKETLVDANTFFLSDDNATFHSLQDYVVACDHCEERNGQYQYMSFSWPEHDSDVFFNQTNLLNIAIEATKRNINVNSVHVGRIQLTGPDGKTTFSHDAKSAMAFIANYR